MVICNSLAVIYASPDYTSEQVDEMLYGEEATVLAEENGFYKIRSEYDYVGWTPKTNLFPKSKDPNFRINCIFSDLLVEGRYHYEPFMALPRGAKLNVEFSENSYRYAYVSHPNEFTFYIHKNHLTALEEKQYTEQELRERFAETAKEYLGVQYRWGGRSHKGIDCSGLCFNAYWFNGYTLWRDANIDRSTILRKIPLEEAKKGDLLFFKGHVAMCLGDGNIIHASASVGNVAIERLKDKEWLLNNFVGAGTVF